jgi:hypothetical protein
MHTHTDTHTHERRERDAHRHTACLRTCPVPVHGAPAPPRRGGCLPCAGLTVCACRCGPCRTTIPHLTELQRQYGRQGLVIMGITSEPSSAISGFLQEMGAKMDYVVACDARNEARSKVMQVRASAARVVAHVRQRVSDPGSFSVTMALSPP